MIKDKNLQHLAVIMDGNTRWAKDNGSPKINGYRRGVDAAQNLIKNALDLQIPYLSLYVFSSENWKRSQSEVTMLLKMLGKYLEDLNFLASRDIKLIVIGNFNQISSKLRATIENAMELTKNNKSMTLCLAFSYGGRLEITEACNKIIASGKQSINEQDFAAYLYEPNMPDVDLLIRTSGTMRLSNFLLWQIAYAELFFCKKYWPDFNKHDLIEAVEDYSKRKRNFGAR